MESTIKSTQSLTKMALSLALVVICSQLAVPIGPVPITLQTLAVLIIGLTLTPTQAFIVMSLYMVGGLLGLPFFAGFSGGLQSLVSPSFGFVIGFIPAASIGAWLVNDQKSTTKYIYASLAMTLIIYIFGILYMFLIANVVNQSNWSIAYILQLALIPFIPGDLLKAVLAILISKRIRR